MQHAPIDSYSGIVEVVEVELPEYFANYHCCRCKECIQTDHYFPGYKWTSMPKGDDSISARHFFRLCNMHRLIEVGHEKI